MSTAKKPSPYRRYRQEEITRGLMALLVCAGSPTEASKMLAAGDPPLEVPAETLSSWKRTKHAQEYARLADEYRDQLETSIAQEFRELARLAAEAEREAIEKTLLGLQSGRIRDPHRAAADMAKVKAENVQKLLALTGRPTQITEHRDVSQIVRALSARGVNVEFTPRGPAVGPPDPAGGGGPSSGLRAQAHAGVLEPGRDVAEADAVGPVPGADPAEGQRRP